MIFPQSTERGKAVDVRGVGKSFGSVTALRDVSFEVNHGEVVALLGPNGACKTTIVDILSTLTRPDCGRALVAGHDVVTEAAMVRRSVMLTGQHVSLDEMLTGYENLLVFARLHGMHRQAARDRARELLGEFGLEDAADRRVGTYSGGMRRRVDIACGLVVRPEVVFLDEPTTGLDPRSRQAIWELVGTFKSAGIATLLTTQYLAEADELSDRIILLDRGRIVAQGTAGTLKEHIGGAFCEFVPKDPADVDLIAEALEPLPITVKPDRVVLAAPEGPRTLAAALARLNSADIALVDIALRGPSLDDVFLSLTGDA